MGKRLIIKGADFSENAIVNYYIPFVSLHYNEQLMFSNKQWTFINLSDELVGKTINGFEVRFTNDLPENLSKSATITFGENVISMTCEFQLSDTIITQTYFLDEPFTFENNSFFYYTVTGNVNEEHRGGCDVFRRNRASSEVPEYDFSVEISQGGTMLTLDCTMFTKLFLV